MGIHMANILSMQICMTAMAWVRSYLGYYASGGIYIAGENGNDLFPNAGNGDEGASEVEPPPPQDPADALFDDPDEKAFGVSKPLTLDRDPTAPKADPPGEPCTFENRCNAAKEA
ncbi:unnamed protein product [Amoebophrya sp. A120]|nr:unnamed protein product [Amoebophrya sp. A120]|eukprot:GSA120T00010685001.1